MTASRSGQLFCGAPTAHRTGRSLASACGAVPGQDAAAGAAGLGLEDPVRRPGRPRRRGTRVPGHDHPGVRPVPVRRRAAAPRRPARRWAGTSCGARWSAWTRWRGCAPGSSPTPACSSSASPAPASPPSSSAWSPARWQPGRSRSILGDTKPDYAMLTKHLDGQVIRIGRGLDRINPLDAGPLGQALRRMPGPDCRRAALGGPQPPPVAADGACARWSGRRASPTPRKSSSAGPSTCSTSGWRGREPVVPDVLAVIEPGPRQPALGGPRRHARALPGPRRRPGLHPRPAVHRIAGRGVRRADLPADRPERAGRVGGHLPRRRGRGQAADRRDAVHLGVRVRDGRRRRRAGRARDRAAAVPTWP